MSKLSVKDRLIILVATVCLMVYGGYNYLWLPADAKVNELKNKETELKSLQVDKKPLDDKVNSLEIENTTLIKKITDLKGLGSNNAINKQDFLIFLGDVTETNNVKMTKFSDLGLINENNGIWQAQFDLELKGDLSGINKVCNEIDNMGIKYSVSSVSLRQNMTYPYLERSFDSFSSLPWYKDTAPNPSASPSPSAMPSATPEIIPPIVNAPPKPYIEESPIQTPVPTPPATPKTEMPEDNNGNIKDRLNKLLETAYHYQQSKISFIPLYTTNITLDNNFDFLNPTDIVDESKLMKLNITIQFTMYSDPNNSHFKQNSTKSGV